MANLFKFLIPQEKKFFPLFEKASGNLLETAVLLTKMVNTTDAEKRRELLREIERLEHIGDSVTHEIFTELSTTFITPFDREDIHALTSAVDDVVDFIHGSAKRIELYKIHVPDGTISKFAELIEKGGEELHKAISALRDLKNVDAIRAACVRINSIENHADDIFDNAIARLFEEKKDAIEIIKIKEVLSVLETATDKCEDAANVLETIIVKNV
jgi:predicted phosphate transport protein (TIGR00153 family)